MTREFVCGAAFEELSDEEMMTYDGGSPVASAQASAKATTWVSSLSCGVVSASITGLATVTILITTGKI